MSANQLDFDVVVSGYGPAGQAVASLLAQKGHRVCVFERFPRLYGLPRLCTIDGETARIVQDAGEVEQAFRESTWCRRFEMFDGEYEHLMTIDWSDNHICGYPGRISFYQPDVEATMDAVARAHGAEVNQGWEIVDFEQRVDEITINARQRRMAYDEDPAEERTVTTRYLLGADGARSSTREALGIERRDFEYRDAFLSVDVERVGKLGVRHGMNLDRDDTAYNVSAPGRSFGVVPIGRKRIRFEFLVDPDGDHSELLVPEIGYDFLHKAFGLTEDEVKIYRQVVYPFEGKLADEWRVGNAILVGDAAHLMPPFLGQGACSALRDSVNLAWKLDLVLKGVARDELIDTYQEERLPHVETLVKGSIEVGKVAIERDPVKAAERDRRYREGGGHPPDDQLRLTTGILHRDEAGEIASPAPDLMEQGVGRYKGQAGRFDTLVGWGFHVLGFESDPADQLDAEQLAFLDAIGAKVVRITNDPEIDGFYDLDRTYEAWFNENDMLKGVISRPDFTVFGGVWDMADLPALVDDLRRQLRVDVLQPA